MNALPRQQAPSLSFSLTDGESWELQAQQPENFTLIVFYRGLHCPVCKGYNRELNTLLEQFAERGVEVVAVSMDDEQRAKKTVEEWGLDDLSVGYELTEEQARRWDLYLSEGINEEEPDLFSEPGLFLVKPDGTLYYAARNSMPFGRPDLEGMLQGIDFVTENDYPARGEVTELQAA